MQAIYKRVAGLDVHRVKNVATARGSSVLAFGRGWSMRAT